MKKDRWARSRVRVSVCAAVVAMGLLGPVATANATHTCGTESVDAVHQTGTSFSLSTFFYSSPGPTMLGGGVNFTSASANSSTIVTEDYLVSGSILYEYVQWNNYGVTQSGIFYNDYCA